MDKGLLHPFIHERDLLRWFELSFCFIIISRYSLFNKSSLSPFVQHKLVHIFHKKVHTLIMYSNITKECLCNIKDTYPRI